jgi:hypothetical protein
MSMSEAHPALSVTVFAKNDSSRLARLPQPPKCSDWVQKAPLSVVNKPHLMRESVV